MQWVYWKQWDSMGEQVTSFFFKSVKDRKTTNFIGALMKEDGNWIADQGALKEEFVSFFKGIYVDHSTDNLNADIEPILQDWLSSDPKISEQQYDLLSVPFTDLEIKRGV